MDDIDLKIYRSLAVSANFTPFTDVRKTNLAIAKELGVDEGTVRNRLDRMVESGFIKGRRVVVNSKVLGKLQVSLRLDVLPPSSKEDVIRKVKLLGGVYLIRDYLGDAIGVDFFSDDETSIQRETELISRIANAENVTQYMGYPGRGRYSFSDLDVKIVKSIREDPRKPFHKVAKETGTSSKTVARRFRRMTDAEALIVANILDYKMAKGVIKGDLAVSYDSLGDRESANAELLRVLGDRVRFSFLEKDFALFSLMFRNVSEQRELLGAIKKVRGVAKAHLDIVVDQVYAYEAYDELLVKHAAQVRLAKELVQR